MAARKSTTRTDDDDYQGPQIDPMNKAEKERFEKDPNWRLQGEIALTVGLHRAGELLAGCGDPKVLADLLKVVSEIVGTGLVLGSKHGKKSEEDDDPDEI